MEDADYETSRLKLKAEMEAAFAEHCKSLPFYEEYETTKTSRRQSYADEWKENVENDDASPRSVRKPRTPRLKSNFYQPIRMSTRAKKLRSNSDSLYIESSDDELLTGLDDERAARLKGKRRRIPVNLAPKYTEPPGVDEVTPYMLDNINYRGTPKIWCKTAAGSTCHQCRQKTLDTKTICRSGRCVGVRGQFCGPCLLNRHGERVSDALLNPMWQCPPCQGLCNCSFCMKKAGLDPTGIVFPSLGPEYNSVREFLAAEQSYPLPDDGKNSDCTDSAASDEDEDEDEVRGMVVEMEEDRLDQIYAQMFPEKASKKRRKKRKRTKQQDDSEPPSFRGFADPIEKPEAMIIIQKLLDRFSEGILPHLIDNINIIASSDLKSDSETDPFLGFEQPSSDQKAVPIINRLLERAMKETCDLEVNSAANFELLEGFVQIVNTQEAEVVNEPNLEQAAAEIEPQALHSMPASTVEVESFQGFEEPAGSQEVELTTQRLSEQFSNEIEFCPPKQNKKSTKLESMVPAPECNDEIEQFVGFEQETASREALVVIERLLNRHSEGILPAAEVSVFPEFG